MEARLGIDNPGNFYLEVAKGTVKGHSIIHKFGAATLTTALRVVSQTGAYQTPLAAVLLEVVSDSAADGVGGIGARKVKIIGLNSSWEEIEQEIELNGVTPVAIPVAMIRLYRWFISESGSYADSTTSSHVGNISIQALGAGTVWDTIPVSPVPTGQSVIGVYTVPIKKTGFLLSKKIFVDSSKAADIFFFQRPFANDVTAPYKGTRRMIEREVGLAGTLPMDFVSPKGPFVGPCDIGFIGSVSVGTAEASVEFELILVDS